MNLFDAAEYAESLSNCKKRPVGCSLAINGEVVAIGFNHADSKCKCKMHEENSKVEHAEICCMKHYEFLKQDYSELAVTYICCLNCSKEIVKRGIRKVYYRDHRPEPDKQLGINYLKSHNVEVSNQWNS